MQIVVSFGKQVSRIMFTQVYGTTLIGIDATIVSIEVNVSRGLNFYLVGLPDNAIKESRRRIEAALINNDYRFPRIKTIVNLAPADLKKEGAAYDLPIAVGILASSGQISLPSLDDWIIMGELSLEGFLKPIKGVLPIAITAKEHGYKNLVVPRENAAEAAVVEGINVFGANKMTQVIELLSKGTGIEAETYRAGLGQGHEDEVLNFSEVKGQYKTKRALEIAAAGGHNAILIGPPGSGKTMLARRIPGILPAMSFNESLETTKIYSVAGLLGAARGLISKRPFRSPHHTISDAGLVGGGTYPIPGEISLAHNGVLFLDELPEFKRTVLEVMRQPMEDRQVTISRARLSVDFPAGFMLIAAMNPCPCGFYNHPSQPCSCASGMVQKYLNRISGPLLDRIDLHVEVHPVEKAELISDIPAEKSSSIRQRVQQAREIQQKRFDGIKGIHSNAQIHSGLMKKYCPIGRESVELLTTAMDRLKLSARAYDRIIKVSRTIADLEKQQTIQTAHIAEAIQFRSLDRENWGN